MLWCSIGAGAFVAKPYSIEEIGQCREQENPESPILLVGKLSQQNDDKQGAMRMRSIDKALGRFHMLVLPWTE